MSSWFETYGWGPVAAQLVTGAYPQDAADVAVLHGAGVDAVLNLCADSEYARGARAAVAAAYAEAGMVEHRIPSEDYGNVAGDLLDAAVELVNARLDAGDTVYLHCRAGWQRSATAAAAVLAVRFGVEPMAALADINRRRPAARPLPHQVRDLLSWWELRPARPAGGTPPPAR